MKFEIELTDEMVSQFETIKSTRSNRSNQQIFEQIVERGLYNLVYRSQYNVVKYNREKEMREEFKEFKKSLVKK